MIGHMLLLSFTLGNRCLTWVGNRTLDLLPEPNQALLVTIPRKLIAVRVFFAPELLEQVVGSFQMALGNAWIIPALQVGYGVIGQVTQHPTDGF